MKKFIFNIIAFNILTISSQSIAAIPNCPSHEVIRNSQFADARVLLYSNEFWLWRVNSEIFMHEGAAWNVTVVAGLPVMEYNSAKAIELTQQQLGSVVLLNPERGASENGSVVRCVYTLSNYKYNVMANTPPIPDF